MALQNGTNGSRAEALAQSPVLAVAARLSAVVLAPLFVMFISWAALSIVSSSSRVTILEHDTAGLVNLLASRVDERDLKLRDLRMDQIDKRADTSEHRADLLADRLIKLEDILRPVQR